MVHYNECDLYSIAVLLLAYMKGNANLCRAIVRAGARLGVNNNQGINIFNYQVATKQLLFRLLGKFSHFIIYQAFIMYYSFSQSRWYISQISIEIHKNYLFNLHIKAISLCFEHYQMLWHIHVNDYIQLSAVSYCTLAIAYVLIKMYYTGSLE